MVFSPSLSVEKAKKLEFSLILQLLGASLFIALMTHIKVYLPFTPVPITGQTAAVATVGALLGSRKGVAAVLIYLAEGFLGLPVFTAGSVGVAALIGPTGGYLIGFMAQAYFIGRMVERKSQLESGKLFALILISHALVFLCGLLFLLRFIEGERLLQAGLYPFIPGEVLKALALTLFLKKLRVDS